ncbi:PE family protein [Mycobacterium kansasii 732]|nr:PE family protein [Mycobacterium kansasii 732]
MSFVVAVPEMFATARADLSGLGAVIAEADAAAAAATTAVLAAGADEVWVAIATLFGSHGQAYQALRAQAAKFHAQFVQTLAAAGSSYAAAEAANVDRRCLGAINAPAQALLGRPLIGNGANGAPGQPGGPGGLLYGNGGNGGASVTAGVAVVAVERRD